MNFDSGLQTPGALTSNRLFTLSRNNVEYSFNIPSQDYIVASQLSSEFAKYMDRFEQSAEDTDSGTSLTETSITSQAQLLLIFVGFLATKDHQEHEIMSFTQRVLREFDRAFLAGNDIHTLVGKFDLPTESKFDLTRSYYSACSATNRKLKTHESALFRMTDSDADATKIYAVFGGQGFEDYFAELEQAYRVYNSFVGGFIAKQSKHLEKLSVNLQLHYHKGLEVHKWITNAESRPDQEYLISAPVSLPVIGILQFARYMIVCKILGKNPDQLLQKISGFSGHSQGIVTAAAIAASSTWAEYEENARNAIELLFYIGGYSQSSFPISTIPPTVLKDSLSEMEGAPSPMLSIRDLPINLLEREIGTTNQHLNEADKVFVSLVNGPRNCVVSGPPKSLYGLNLALRRIKAAPGENQNRIPFSKRKLRFTTRFLRISAPFHSPYLGRARENILNVVYERKIKFSNDLLVSVFSTENGEDLAIKYKQDHVGLISALIDLILTKPVNWEKATGFKDATHIIDFGPGGNTGIGFLTHRNKEGLGIRVIFAGSFSGGESGSLEELFDINETAIFRAPNWTLNYRPALVRTRSGKILVDTKMSRLLGRPPVMVGGMTPCTFPWEFVRDTMNAGYQIELAGGGYFAPQQLANAISKIEASTTPGQGIVLNCIYINPSLFGWQTNLVKQLRASGVPIEGLTVAAGIPSIDIANDLIQTLGLRYLGLKPGSTEAIAQTIAIARANPTFPIVCQWTGGRAGGHHSFEDFHSPILHMYASIRKCSNIVLVAGSGFGGADDTFPYLTGEWSAQFNYPCMPFDGILLASRVMVSKEAKTSQQVKELIVAAPGLSDAEWEKTYDGPAGGVITVLSELGEPIHKIATRGILFWKELDDTIFSLPKAKRLPALLAKKDYYIKRLNEDFQKVYFPANLVEQRAIDEKWVWKPATDLDEMTYSEVSHRLVDLLYVLHQNRWIDITMRNLVGDWIARIEERFTREMGKQCILQSNVEIEKPYPRIIEILKHYPEASIQKINAQDVQHFLTLCRRVTQKPVPFVPVIDENFEFYFKKDSLWQSEDVDAVVGQDVGRVAILQGPMAAQHSKIVNEPIKQILDGIHLEHIEKLKKLYYSDESSQIPYEEYFGMDNIFKLKEKSLEVLPDVTFKASDNEQYFEISKDAIKLPDQVLWLNALAGEERSWRRALFLTDDFVKGTKLQANPIQRLFKPRLGQIVKIENFNLKDQAIVSLFELIQGVQKLAVKVSLTKENLIEVMMYEDRNPTGEPVGLPLMFDYVPECGFAPIREILDDRILRVNQFYWKIWCGNEAYPVNSSVQDTFYGEDTIIKGSDIENFCRVIGNHHDRYIKRGTNKQYAPMDFSIVVGWKAMVKALFAKEIHGDLLNLVHLSNSFRYLADDAMLCEGDEISSEGHISSILITPSGKMVQVSGRLIREKKPIIEVRSEFLYRGHFDDFENTFKQTDESPVSITLSSAKDVAILCSKEWFILNDPNLNLLGTTLTFRLKSLVKYKNETVMDHVQTDGAVYYELPTKEVVQIATVSYESFSTYENPVLSYLKRHGTIIEQPLIFENPRNVVKISADSFNTISITPISNVPYARISADYNPIHVSPTFAAYAMLPGIEGITHGMYTSAVTRTFVETFAADNNPERVVSYKVNFVDMVMPNTKLITKLKHYGMVGGKKLIKVETFISDTDIKVLDGSAEIEQPRTAYIFTGQGSQEQGMGQDLYNTSATAQAIWDTADQHFIDTYGFSILKIVRENPKSYTIHFGGAKGKQIRKNYISMVYEVVQADGTVERSPIFKDITEDSQSYTFYSPHGLLSATQFTQPALTLMEKAAFEDMRVHGVVQSQCSFAGHSLGEYSCLASIAGVMPIESLVDIVFYRGLTMQVAVERDDKNRSSYSMIAINPSRVSVTFSESALKYVVESIATKLDLLLEIVNYNVTDQQYVAAGHNHALGTLTDVLNFIKIKNVNIDELMQQLTMENLKQHLYQIIDVAYQKVLISAKESGYYIVERGYATIPLSVDVPFHSSFLRAGVKPFRQYLYRRIPRKLINPQQLVGKYIPNLTAKPFQISKEYFEEVYQLTGSPKISQILANWSKFEED